MSSFLSLGLVTALAMVLAGQGEGTGLREALCLDNMGPNGPSLETFSGKGRELSLCVREYRKKYGQDFECGRNLRGRTCVQIKDHFQSFLDDLSQCLAGPTTTPAATTITTATPLPKPCDCQDIFDRGNTGTLVTFIYPDGQNPVEVKCINGATVLFNRNSPEGNYSLPIEDYEDGFGDRNGDYFLGLTALLNLTSKRDYRLVVNVTFENSTKAQAIYSSIDITGRDDLYRLTVGMYSGQAGNSLLTSNGTGFSTKEFGVSRVSAESIGGGFWWVPFVSENRGRPTATTTSLLGLYIWDGEPAESFVFLLENI